MTGAAFPDPVNRHGAALPKAGVSAPRGGHGAGKVGGRMLACIRAGLPRRIRESLAARPA